MPGINPVTNDVLLVTLASYTPSQAGLNNLHYIVLDTSGGGVTLAELANAIDALVAAPMKAWLGTNARWRGVSVRNLAPPATPGYAETGSDGPGLAGAGLPTQTSGLITLKTAVGGPGGRGRIYPPFPGQDFVADTGGMNLAGLTALVDLCAAIPVLRNFTAFGGGTCRLQLVVASSLLHWEAGVPLPTPLSVTELKPQGAFATQRRRGQFGRINPEPF